MNYYLLFLRDELFVGDFTLTIGHTQLMTKTTLFHTLANKMFVSELSMNINGGQIRGASHTHLS